MWMKAAGLVPGAKALQDSFLLVKYKVVLSTTYSSMPNFVTALIVDSVFLRRPNQNHLFLPQLKITLTYLHCVQGDGGKDNSISEVGCLETSDVMNYIYYHLI